MHLRRYAEIGVVHIEPETYEALVGLSEHGPGRPGGRAYDPEDSWHQLIVEPHSYGCWVHTEVAEIIGDDLPQSLLAILRDAAALDASWVLFDADMLPSEDRPVFDHGDGPERPSDRAPDGQETGPC